MSEKRKNGDGMHPTVKAAFITGAFAVIVAIIAAIPVGSQDRPLACSFDIAIVQGVYACNSTVNNISNVPDTYDPIGTSVAATLTAQVPETIQDAVDQTMTAITLTEPARRTPQFTPNVPIRIIDPTPEFLQELNLIANTNQGTQFQAPESGNYTFKYVDGAYSTYPLNVTPALPSWSSIVVIFKGSSPLWNGEAIDDASALLVLAITDGEPENPSWWSSAEDAISAAKQTEPLTVYLSAGEVITLLTVDEQSHYRDNFGSVTISITYKP